VACGVYTGACNTAWLNGLGCSTLTEDAVEIEDTDDPEADDVLDQLEVWLDDDCEDPDDTDDLVVCDDTDDRDVDDPDDVDDVTIDTEELVKLDRDDSDCDDFDDCDDKLDVADDPDVVWCDVAEDRVEAVTAEA